MVVGKLSLPIPAVNEVMMGILVQDLPINLEVLKRCCSITNSNRNWNAIRNLLELPEIKKLRAHVTRNRAQNMPRIGGKRLEESICDEISFLLKWKSDNLNNLYDSLGNCGQLLATRAHDRALSALKHHYSHIAASIHILVGLPPEIDGVTYEQDIFLNARSLLSLSNSEICGLLAHELIHARLAFPKPEQTLTSFIRVVLEEGLATRAQLNFPPNSEDYLRWADQMNKTNLKNYSDGLKKDIEATASAITIADLDVHLTGARPGYAVGFAIIENGIKEMDFGELIGLARNKPSYLWNKYIDSVPSYDWNETDFPGPCLI
ncbi:DUF2268 domain-containing putative Zn-dependent protease [Desulfomonile tiedjei]|nr:DUF2268 domain-containing putative Zn-dependent protease [Desulfomonile tiedjei]